MKSKYFRILWDIWATYIYDCTAKEFNKRYWTEIEEWVTLTQSWVEPIMWLNNPSIYSIAHECVHAIHHIARIADIQFSEDSEEFFAYNIGYLSREICKIHELYPTHR